MTGGTDLSDLSDAILNQVVLELGINFARVKSISSSTQLTMWIIITEPGIPAMKSGQLMP